MTSQLEITMNKVRASIDAQGEIIRRLREITYYARNNVCDVCDIELYTTELGGIRRCDKCWTASEMRY